ncbi:MAG: hypothetical protein QM753_11695 [Thermomicrobiales bacterium]
MQRMTNGIRSGSAAIVIHHDHRQRIDNAGRKQETDYAGGGALLGSFDAQVRLVNKDGLIHVKVDAANEGNDFEATYRTEQRQIGTHKTWIMLDAEPIQKSDEKPNLALLAIDVLGSQELSQKEWHRQCLEDERIVRHWPKLNASSLSTLAKEHPDTITSRENKKDRREVLYSVA